MTDAAGPRVVTVTIGPYGRGNPTILLVLAILILGVGVGLGILVVETAQFVAGGPTLFPARGSGRSNWLGVALMVIADILVVGGAVALLRESILKIRRARVASADTGNPP